jgi:tetratricopeptide (TPR) repeat protein
LVLALLAEVDIEILVEDWSAARERAAEARVVVEQIAGADSPIAAAAYSQAALVHVLTGEHERAWPLLEQADGIADQAALPVSFRVHLWSTRGKALHAAGRATEAVPEFEKAVALQEQVGAEVLDRAQVDFHLARALHETGEEDRALALGRDALATFVTLGPGARVYRQWTEDWLDEIGAAR